MHQDSYQLQKSYKYCVYIQPHLYVFLKKNHNENLSSYLEYLSSKYQMILISKKKKSSLQKATIHYQPKTKNYKRIILRKISPKVWKKLKELKSMTGYSISCIIRIFLEWELQSQGFPISSLIPIPFQEIQQDFMSNNLLAINNYIHSESWNRTNNEVNSYFLDFP